MSKVETRVARGAEKLKIHGRLKTEGGIPYNSYRNVYYELICWYVKFRCSLRVGFFDNKKYKVLFAFPDLLTQALRTFEPYFFMNERKDVGFWMHEIYENEVPVILKNFFIVFGS
jgi:hypothetical protein